MPRSASRHPTSSRGVLWCLLIGSVVVPLMAGWLSATAPSFAVSRLTLITGSASAALLAAGCGVWFWRGAAASAARPAPAAAARGPVALAAALLAAGWGSVAWAAARELRAGTDLQIVNLFVFLIPLGLALALFVQFTHHVRRPHTPR